MRLMHPQMQFVLLAAKAYCWHDAHWACYRPAPLGLFLQGVLWTFISQSINVSGIILSQAQSLALAFLEFRDIDDQLM